MDGSAPMMKNGRNSLRQIAGRTGKLCLGTLLYYTGALPLMRKTFLREKGIKILAYHRIGESPFVLPGMNIRPDHFEQHLRYIIRRHRPFSLQRAVEILEKRERLPDNAVVITFDDGYRDNYENAFPVLRKYGVPATIFLSVGAIEERSALWFDVITEAFRATRRTECVLGNGLIPFVFRSLRDRLFAAQETVENGKKLAPGERERYLSQVLDMLEVRREELPLERYMMNWNEIVRMGKEGIDFGSHGMSHTVVTALSPDEFEREIDQSRAIIRVRTGIDASLYAYPNGGEGDFTIVTEQLLNEHGYTAACTLIRGLNDCTVSRYALRRVCVTEGMESDGFGNFARPIFAAALS